MSTDALSDIFKAVRLTGAAFFDVAASGRWCAEQPSRELVLRKVMPGADRLISYHVVVEGECYATMIGGEPLHLDPGEVIVYTRGDPHVMASAPGLRALRPTQAEFDAMTTGPQPFIVRLGDGEQPTAKLVCGFLACDSRPYNPLFDNLPPVITARRSGDSGASWLAKFIGVAVAETLNRRAGGEGVLARLSELMLIEVVRRYVEGLPPGPSGWLAGLRDPFVGKSLALLHAHAARPWTIEDLAREVGLSRSVLAERFADLVGLPPMHYLAHWRMQIAAGRLCDGGSNIAVIASEAGYGSEAAFSRAFKKLVGLPPSEWRRRKAS